MTTKEIIEILVALIVALLGATWVIRKNTQKTSQKQKSGKNSVNIAIVNNHSNEK